MAEAVAEPVVPVHETDEADLDHLHYLVDVVQRLSLASDLPAIQEIVRHAARKLVGSDGATFVLKDGDRCYYADEDAISPLWKGQRFPLEACISGWAMQNRASVAIDDIYADDRIPHDAYRPTFVQSLTMVPIRSTDPLGAIGNYWSVHHAATTQEVALLQALADSTAVAMERVQVLEHLESRVEHRTRELTDRTDEAELLAARLQVEMKERAAAEEAARALSLTDELTGVANRRGFLVRAEQVRAVCQRRGEPSLLLFADLDGLKDLNDSEGHDRGDELIRDAATVLSGTVRGMDVVGRWGGDEFVVFLTGTGDAPAVRRRIDTQASADGVVLSLSLGALIVDPGDLRPLQDLISQADQAMYADKLRRRAARAR